MLVDDVEHPVLADRGWQGAANHAQGTSGIGRLEITVDP
jgi:hypothetical protein